MAATAVKAVETEETVFGPNNGRTPTFHGFETQETGACHVSFGGDIKFLYFIVKTVITNGRLRYTNGMPKLWFKNIYQDPDVLDTWFSSGLWH